MYNTAAISTSTYVRRMSAAYVVRTLESNRRARNSGTV
jgi:hypothetical protein